VTIGQVSDAFAGALVVTIVPEPRALTMMLGSGLILLSLGLRRRKLG
jgi:hypothetical protein